jgi:hypothetical protein
MRPARESSATRRIATLVFALVASAGAAGAAGVSGRVVHSDDPVSKATVYAYRAVERSFEKVATDETGRFLFDALPAGLYKIVAHKIGLPPAVLVLARRSASESQFIQVELSAAKGEPEDDFWSTRASVPGDVLRDLDFGSSEFASAVTRDLAPPRFAGAVTAVASRGDQTTNASADTALTEIALHGMLGDLRVELQGEIERSGGFASASGAPEEALGGRGSSFRLGLEGARGGEFGLVGESREWYLSSNQSAPGALDRLRLSYAGELGDEVETTLAANYLDESGLFQRGKYVPAVFPRASRWLTVEGGYALSLGSIGSLKGGMRYRENELDRLRSYDDLAPSKYLDVWSKGDVELDSTYLVEYGFFSTFRDGRVSVSPRGGLVLRFHPEWQASIAASRRFVASDENPLEGDIAPVTVSNVFACEASEATCVEAELAHGDGAERSFQLRGSWREFDRTVRLFLQDDLFFGDDGLFFVPGDRVPEMSATWTHHVGKSLVASWSTSYAQGGGGDRDARAAVGAGDCAATGGAWSRRE